MEIVLASLPGQVVRIHKNAVAADPWTRVERHKAKRLRGRRLNHFPDVDATHAVAHPRQLVDKGNVHAPEDVLQQLGHLRSARAAHDVHVVHHLLDCQLGQLRAARRHTAHHDRCVLRGELFVARINSLRRKSQVKILSHLETGFLQPRQHHFFGGFGKRRALQNDQLADSEAFANFVRGGLDVGNVRILVRRKRRGNADVDNIALADVVERTEGFELATLDNPRQLLVRDVEDVVLATV